jgi:hypothetical protein
MRAFTCPVCRHLVTFESTECLHAINRSLGEGDPYPFVLAPAVIDKLAFIDTLVRTHA